MECIFSNFTHITQSKVTAPDPFLTVTVDCPWVCYQLNPAFLPYFFGHTKCFLSNFTQVTQWKQPHTNPFLTIEADCP